MIIPTFVAKSMIHGYGCFTGETIRKDQLVWNYDPEVDHILVNAYSHWERIHAYGSKKFNSLVLPRDNAAFLNFSDNPNLKEGFVGDTGEVCLLAARRISVDEELTVSYSSDTDWEWKLNPEL
jgi:SET domain-containing protein